MSQYNIKHSVCLLMLRASWVMAVTLAGCTDYLIGTAEIPDTEVEIKGEVFFRPLATTEIQTRGEAPGGAQYLGIKSLYVFFFNPEKELLKEYSGYVDFTPAPSEGSTHGHVTFTKKIQAGRYYAYAVANIPDEDRDRLETITTTDRLRDFKVSWNDDMAKDLEMFGVFRQDDGETIPDNEDFEPDELLAVTPATNGIRARVRRTVSKVTVDFDGSALKEGVTVYIRKATLKDVADSIFLGRPSAAGADNIRCTGSAYSITYGTGESHGSWPSVTKDGAFLPKDVWPDRDITGFHDDRAMALPCYENLQGEPEGKSKLQDADGDGLIDSSPKDGVDNGTYLEVEGYYVANRPEYKSQGEIKYRFMLGKDAVRNFDLVRNHHYKITMRFKDYGNDVDWHIVYADRFLDATYPDDVNYRGRFFVPDPDYNNLPNAGHTFDDRNVITVTSYERDDSGKHWQEPEITYAYYTRNEQTGEWDTDNTTSGWLTLDKGTLIEEEGKDPQKQYTFTAAMAESVPASISSLFPTAPAGSRAEPYNLSNKNGKGTVENTANCYMVGAPGWYCFPLVYGNAITDEETNTAAYSSAHIVNHLNANITAPYIQDNVDLSDAGVRLIWQDADNLVEPGSIAFDPTLFGGKGGITFHIGAMQEGNAVIALIDNRAGEDEFVDIDRGGIYGKGGSTKAIWSWHIWATRFGFGNFETDIRVINHDGKAFDVMPVNLGWCSGGQEVRYYKRRKCEITFKVGEHEIVRTIEQYPHLVLPRGDHPYYQWGRKDPFVGTNLSGGNKARWNHSGTKYDIWSQYNPPRLYVEPGMFENNKRRKHTRDCLDVLVKNPDKWHNAPRDPINPEKFDEGFYSINKSYDDLWSNAGEKTVYDPCPPGYRVADNSVFTGFTTTGKDETAGINWHDVLESDMPGDYYAGSSINSQVLELYTDTRKIQSIIFPVSGYRDYDKEAGVVNYPAGNYNGEGYVWFSTAYNPTNAYHLKFIRDDLKDGNWKTRGTLIASFEKFYNTDGFAVRPVRTSTK